MNPWPLIPKAKPLQNDSAEEMKCYAAEQQAGSASGSPCIGKRYKTSLCALSESEATYTGAVLDPLLFLPVLKDDGRCCKRCSQCVCFGSEGVHFGGWV